MQIQLFQGLAFVIMYSGCPVCCCSKLQTEITLPTIETEYIAFVQVPREVIPIMKLLCEINEAFPTNIPTPQIYCKSLGR